MRAFSGSYGSRLTDILLIVLATGFVVGSCIFTVLEHRQTNVEWAVVTNDVPLGIPQGGPRSFGPGWNEIEGVVARTASDRLAYLPGEYEVGDQLCLRLDEGEITEFRVATVLSREDCE